MSEDLKHIITELLSSSILPEYVKTSQAVRFLDNDKFKRKQLYKIRLELKGKRIGKGQNFVFPIKELVKLKRELQEQV